MSVSRCQREIDSHEFSEWQAYFQINPFGEVRSDARMARLCALIANVNRGRRGKSFKDQDFMFQFGGKKRQTQADIAAVLDMVTAMARGSRGGN